MKARVSLLNAFLIILSVCHGSAASGYQPRVGRMVSLKVEGGPEAAAFEVKGGQSQGKIILVFHDRKGLNDEVKMEAERLYSETQSTVLALDFFNRKIPADSLQAAVILQQTDEGRVVNIIKAGLDYAGKFGRIQTVGYGTGGSRALQAALMAGQRAYGCLIYYSVPQPDTTMLKELACPVAGFYSISDRSVPREQINRLKGDMDRAGKDLKTMFFDAPTGFALAGPPVYHSQAAKNARIEAVAFLRKNFETPFRKPVDAGSKE